MEVTGVGVFPGRPRGLLNCAFASPLGRETGHPKASTARYFAFKHMNLSRLKYGFLPEQDR